MPKTQLNITQDPDKIVSKDLLATAIVKISDSMRQLLASGLNRKAIVVLVHDSIPKSGYGPSIGKRDVEAVFGALEQLKERYTR